MLRDSPHLPTTSPTHYQISLLRGRVAVQTAGVGLVMIAAGAFVIWALHDGPKSALAGAAVMFVPALGLGGAVVGLAAAWHFGLAEWCLSVDADGVCLVI